jgi:hypothetical protein
MPSLPFFPSCNDTETDDDERHEPIRQSGYSPSESRGDASVGYAYGSNEDEDQAEKEADEAEGLIQGFYSLFYTPD